LLQHLERSSDQSGETERLKQLVSENSSLKERTSALQNQLQQLLEKLKNEKEKVSKAAVMWLKKYFLVKTLLAADVIDTLQGNISNSESQLVLERQLFLYLLRFYGYLKFQGHLNNVPCSVSETPLSQ